jgi:hypothetical protein
LSLILRTIDGIRNNHLALYTEALNS